MESSSSARPSLAEIDELLFAQQQRIDTVTCHPNANVNISLPAVIPQQQKSLAEISQQKKPLTKLELVVRLDYLGLLCGPGGTRLREIQSGSGCTRIEVMKYKGFYCEGLEWSIIQIEGEEAKSERGLDLLSQAYEHGINVLWSKKGPGLQDAIFGLRRPDVEEITREELFVPVHVIGPLLGVKGRGLASQLQSSYRVAIHCKTDVSGCIFAVVASRGQRWVTAVIDGVEAQALEARSILEAEMTRLVGESKEKRCLNRMKQRKALGGLILHCAAPPPGLNVSVAVPEVVEWTAATFPVAESFPCLPQKKMRKTLFGDEVLAFMSNKLGGELKVRLRLRGLGSGASLDAPGAADPMHVHVSAHTPAVLSSALEHLQRFLAGAATTRSHEFIENEKKTWKKEDKAQRTLAWKENKKREEEELAQRGGIAVVEVTPPDHHHEHGGGWQHQHQSGNGGSNEIGGTLLQYGAAIGLSRFLETRPSKLPFRIGYLGGDRVTMDIGIPSSQHMWPVVQEMISDLEEQAQGFNLSLNPLTLGEIQPLGWGGGTNHGVRIWGGAEDCQAFLSCVEGNVHELLRGPVNEVPPYAPPLLSHKRKAEEWGGYTMVDTYPLHHTNTAKI